MGFVEEICRWNKCNKSDINNICLNIETENMVYPLAFIEFEDEDFIGINYTEDDFTERFVVLNKKYVISMAMVYANEIYGEEKDEYNKDVHYM